MAKNTNAEFKSFVMKQKPLIDASMDKTQVIKTSYTEKEHDLLNALLYTLQTKTFSQNTLDFWNNQSDIESRTFIFTESDLRKLAKIKDTANGALKDIIRGLRDKRIEIKNFTVTREIDGKIKSVKQHHIGSLIESATFEKLGSTVSVKLQLSPVFVLFARKDYNIENGNFALIPYEKERDLSALVPKKLLEWASKYDGNTMLLRANEEHLEKICNKQPAFAHYKRILNANFPKLSNLADFKIITWNSKLKFCEIDVEWKIERPNADKSPFSSLYAFIKHVRKYNVNEVLITIDQTEKILCNDKGVLYNYDTLKIYSTEEAEKLWQMIYDYHKKKVSST